MARVLPGSTVARISSPVPANLGQGGALVPGVKPSAANPTDPFIAYGLLGAVQDHDAVVEPWAGRDKFN